MKLRENKMFNQVISVVISFIIPALANYVAMLLWKKGTLPWDGIYFSAYCAIITAICAMLFVIIYYGFMPHFKWFRVFRKYEGRWLQIIPDKPEMPYAIIDFVFDHEDRKYEMYGFNFDKTLEDGTSFQAYKFVERAFNNGFYYITDRTNENKNGLGKISFIKSNYDNLTRAVGYFFDSSNELCSKKYNTIMIKCDKKFLRHIGVEYSYLKLNKIPPKEVMEKCQKFADEQIKIYRKKQRTYNVCCKKAKYKINRSYR